VLELVGIKGLLSVVHIAISAYQNLPTMHGILALPALLGCMVMHGHLDLLHSIGSGFPFRPCIICCLQSKASEGIDGLQSSDFRRSGEVPITRRISEEFPVIITPSEQVSEEVHLRTFPTS